MDNIRSKIATLQASIVDFTRLDDDMIQQVDNGVLDKCREPSLYNSLLKILLHLASSNKPTDISLCVLIYRRIAVKFPTYRNIVELLTQAVKLASRFDSPIERIMTFGLSSLKFVFDIQGYPRIMVSVYNDLITLVNDESLPASIRAHSFELIHYLLRFEVDEATKMKQMEILKATDPYTAERRMIE